MFCKLYATKTGHQILVKLSGDDENNPEVRFYCEPDGLGVCSIAAKYPDTNEGWNQAQDVFEKVTEDTATEMANRIFASTTGLVD